MTEGDKKADSLASRGCCAISLTGVWNWRGTDEKGGNIALASFNDIAWKGKDADGNPIQRPVFMVFDSDSAEKPSVNKALKAGAAYFTSRGAKVSFVRLPRAPDGSKTGVDDFFARGGTVDLLHLHTTDRPPNTPPTDVGDAAAKVLSPDEIRRTMRESAGQLSEPHSLQHVKDVYSKWLYIEDYGLLEILLSNPSCDL